VEVEKVFWRLETGVKNILALLITQQPLTIHANSTVTVSEGGRRWEENFQLNRAHQLFTV